MQRRSGIFSRPAEEGGSSLLPAAYRTKFRLAAPPHAPAILFPRHIHIGQNGSSG
jgi:hypothetical protein